MAGGTELSDNDKAFVEACAGAIGSVAATWFIYPLDTARARYQATTRLKLVDGSMSRPAGSVMAVMRDTAREEGLSALYRGMGVRSAHALSQAFVYFFAYNVMRRKYEAATKQKVGIGTGLLLGLFAGWCNTALTEPLDTLATFKQTMKKPLKQKQGVTSGRADTAPAAEGDAIASPSGNGTAASPSPRVAEAGHKPNLYSSLYVSLLLAFTPSIQTTVFEQIRTIILNRRKEKGGPNAMSVAEAFLLGATAKACASVAMYPIIRTKVVLQAGTLQTTSISGTMRELMQREGPGGLYKGIEAQLLRTVIVGALLLMVKEKSFGAAYLSLKWLQAKKQKPI